MPDASGRFRGSGWSRAREDGWERAFGSSVDLSAFKEVMAASSVYADALDRHLEATRRLHALIDE